MSVENKYVTSASKVDLPTMQRGVILYKLHAFMKA